MSDRPVATDALATLGTVIGEGERRDAIHLAVEPVIAKSQLIPGDHVTFDGQRVRQGSPEAVGIVDPFLTSNVQAGERFWLIVYPRQINSLRHVWTHPAFPDTPEIAYAKAREGHHPVIQRIADGLGVDYDELIEHARDYHQSQEHGSYGEYWVDGGRFEGESVPDEFWPAYEEVTGMKVAESHRGSFLSCSC